MIDNNIPAYDLATAQSQNWSLYYYDSLILKRDDVRNMNTLLWNMRIEGEDR